MLPLERGAAGRAPAPEPLSVRQAVREIAIATRGRGLYELTERIVSWVGEARIETGLLTLYIRHTSASLLIQENADAEVQRDFERFFARLVPDGDALFEHASEGPDDMPAHVRTALTATSLSIPVLEGRPVLGTWQGIYLWEHRTHGHRRRVVVHLCGE